MSVQRSTNQDRKDAPRQGQARSLSINNIKDVQGTRGREYSSSWKEESRQEQEHSFTGHTQDLSSTTPRRHRGYIYIPASGRFSLIIVLLPPRTSRISPGYYLYSVGCHRWLSVAAHSDKGPSLAGVEEEKMRCTGGGAIIPPIIPHLSKSGDAWWFLNPGPGFWLTTTPLLLTACRRSI